jgi:hypothetical protein
MGLGSEIRDPEKTYSGSRIPDPGVKKAPDPGSATLVRAAHGRGRAAKTHWFQEIVL